MLTQSSLADRVVIAGHARLLLAARKLGLSEAPVIIIEGLTENQRRALAIAGNKLPMNAGWDVIGSIERMVRRGQFEGGRARKNSGTHHRESVTDSRLRRPSTLLR